MAINPTDILRNGNPIKKLSQIKLFVNMMRDHFSKKYTGLASWVVPVLVIGLIYTVSPVDFISDFIPLLGWADDLAVLGLLYKFVSGEIAKYEAWTKNKTSE